MKKNGLLILALIVIMGMLVVGCDSGKAMKTAAANTKKAPSDYSGTITFWTAWADDQGVAQWITDFNVLYPNIKVQTVKYANKPEGNVQVNTSLLAGEKIDVLVSYSPAYLMPRLEGGLLYDITDFATREGVKFEDEWGSRPQYKGRDYVIPYGGNNDSVYVNTSKFKEAGIEIPIKWTKAEMINIARRLTKGEGSRKVYGFSNFHGIDYWARFARGVIGDDYFYKKDGSSNYDHPAFKDTLQMEYDLQIKEKIQYPFMEYKSTGIETPDVLFSKKAAMVVSTAYICRWINNPAKYPRDFKVSVVPMPALYDTGENYNAGIFNFSYIGIGAKTTEAEAAWQFAKWLGREGSAGLSQVGHLPLWKNGDPNTVIKKMFGKLDPAEYIDVEAFKRVVLNYKGRTYMDYNMSAVTKVRDIGVQQMEKALTGEVTVETAIANMKKQADEAIKAAKK